MNKLTAFGIALSLSVGSVVAQAHSLPWTAKQKRTIIRGGLCDVATEYATTNGALDMQNASKLEIEGIIINYQFNPDEVLTLWEHERLGELAGLWSVDNCQLYQQAANFMLKQAARAALKAQDSP